MIRQIIEVTLLIILVYLFASYILFLISAVLYGKDQIYGSKSPILRDKIKGIFFL